ncbi:hypothetical protein FACS1894188_09370 [Clostridia bacterium]|nr:hypothetical protein FACS1894188_09370 [Clostridia bacterium]
MTVRKRFFLLLSLVFSALFAVSAFAADPPPPTVAPSLTQVTDTTATFAPNFDSKGYYWTPTTAYLVYADNPNYTNSQKQSINPSDIWQPVTIERLAPNRNYWAKLEITYVVTHLPTRTYNLSSTSLFFTTKTAQTPQNVGNVGSIDFNQTAKTASFTFNITNGGFPIDMGVLWSTSNLSPTITEDGGQGVPTTGSYKINSAPVVPITSAGTYTVSLNELSSYSAYTLRGYMKYYDATSSGPSIATVYTAPYQYSGSAQSTSVPVVSTVSAVLSNGQITASGLVSYTGSTPLVQNGTGFVYSYVLPLPELTNSYNAPAYNNNTNFQTSFAPPQTTGILYVRAYATNTYGTGYGAAVPVDTSNGSVGGKVSLQSVDFVGADTAQFTIYVPVQSPAYIIESGVCVGKSQAPAIDGVNTLEFKSGKTTEGTFSVSASKLEKNTAYYARAYVKTNTGTYYSDSAGKPFNTLKEETILTNEVKDITNTTATAGGKVASGGDYAIRSRGVVYSKTNTMPEITNSEYVQADTTGEGEFNVQLNNLTAYTDYYVRAYYVTVNGYSYGSVRKFKTSEISYVTLTNVKDTNSGELTVAANIQNTINYNVLERGVVYSQTNTSPLVTDSYYRADANVGIGDYSVVIQNLTPGVKYYIKAYVKTNAGYSYSQVKEYTPASSINLKINYKLANGTSVAEETITTAIGQTLYAQNLKIPSNYKLESAFEHKVVGTDTITIVVVPLEPSGTNALGEKAVIKGIGGDVFSPDTTIRRIDVVKMLYELLGNGLTYDGKKFSDVPSSLDGYNAVNFATARGIISGYEDGTFRPNNGLTRGELAVIVVKAYNLSANNTVNVSLTDISSHWARTYITIGVQNGAIAGYEDKTYRPERQVTRAEAVTMFSKLSNRSTTALGTAQFTDVPPTHWAYPYIMNMAVPTA